jgi:hypothetical protein
MAFGNVYVFNLYVEDMAALQVNNLGTAGTIAAPQLTNSYVPSQLKVARTNIPVDDLDSPIFTLGDNSIRVNYGGESWVGVINIPSPPDPAMKADLWLYICYKKAFLFETSGTMLPQNGEGGAAGLKAVGGKSDGGANLTSEGDSGDGKESESSDKSEG